MSDYAIQMSHITKTYNMYTKSSDRFKEAMSFRKKVIMMFSMLWTMLI